MLTNELCRQQKEQLKNTTQILDEVLSESKISDVNLEFNGNFEGKVIE